MKIRRGFLVFVLIVIILSSMSACGSGADSDSGSQSVEEQTISEAEQQAAIQAQTDQQATVGQALPEADPKTNADSLLGSWTDINSPDRFATITKTDTGYQFEDNDGKYPGTYVDGILKVKVSDSETDTADVYFDPQTRHMFLVYMGDQSEFQRK